MAEFQMQDFHDLEMAVDDALNRRAKAQSALDDAKAEVERAYERLTEESLKEHPTTNKHTEALTSKRSYTNEPNLITNAASGSG